MKFDPFAAPIPGSGPEAPTPRHRRSRRSTWAWIAAGVGMAAVVAAVLVIGLSAAPSRPASRPGAAPSALSQAAQPVRLGQLPAPRPSLAASDLQDLLAGTPVLPSGYKPYGKVLAFPGLGQDSPPKQLSCSDIGKIFGELTTDDRNYVADAEVFTLDPAGDELHIELFEAVNPAASARDLAALRADAQACPTVTTSFEGTFHLRATSIPGGSENVDLHMTQSPAGPAGGLPYGPRDFLLIRDGSYLVDIDYTLQSRPGTSRTSNLSLSVLPPSARIAEALLDGLSNPAAG